MPESLVLWKEGVAAIIDQHVLQKLYENYGQELLLYLHSLCGNWNLSEDLLQETFVKALLSLPAQHTNMKAWLYLVARNLCLNTCKKEKRSQPFAEDIRDMPKTPSNNSDSILEYLIRQEDNRILYRAMARLPSRKREVLQLHYFSGLPLREIAHILQITPENARVVSHRAKQELKKYLKEEGYEIS